MLTGETVNFRLNSCASFDDAIALSELLSRETGESYTVLVDNHLGFTARRSGVSAPPVVAKRASRPLTMGKSIYRQSFLGFLGQYLQIAVGALVLGRTTDFLRLLFAAVEISEVPPWMDISAVLVGTRLLGLVVLLYGLRFIYIYLSRKLLFADDGIILKKGIIAQDQVLIRFADIKSLAVRQGILDRLLGIGSLHLDSAATNGDVDIIFDNIAAPVAMRDQIQGLIDYHTGGR